jgi:hypothetical protein
VDELLEAHVYVPDGSELVYLSWMVCLRVRHLVLLKVFQPENCLKDGQGESLDA